MLSQILNITFITALLTAGIAQSVPMIFGSIGDAVGEKGGAIGISVEGELLFGAFFSYLVALRTGSLILGLLAGGLAGALSAMIVAFWAIVLKQDQSIIGIMFNIFATGFTNFLNRIIFGTTIANISVSTFKNIEIPVLSSIPVIGEILFKQNILFYISVLAAIVAYIILKKSSLGLKIAAVGENPKAAQAAGIDVSKVRFGCYAFTGFMAGIAGSSLTLGSVGTFTEAMSAGRGFICLAIVILSRWNCLSTVGFAIGFGTIQALQIRLQILGSPIPYQFLIALPYFVTILVLALGGHNIRAPHDLGVAFEKESR